MPETKKARAPEPKPAPQSVYLKGRVIETKAEPQSPTYWLFQKPGGVPLVGIGTDAQAETYARHLNSCSSINHFTARPITQQEAETLQATVLAAALHGDTPPIFKISDHMARVHVGAPRN